MFIRLTAAGRRRNRSPCSASTLGSGIEGDQGKQPRQQVLGSNRVVDSAVAGARQLHGPLLQGLLSSLHLDDDALD